MDGSRKRQDHAGRKKSRISIQKIKGTNHKRRRRKRSTQQDSVT